MFKNNLIKKMQVIFICIFFTLNLLGQTTFNKLTYNLDSSTLYSHRILGWGVNCLYWNNSIVTLNWSNDSLVQYYTGINIFNDTGSSINQKIFIESGKNYSSNPGRNSLIKTIDNNLVFVGTKNNVGNNSWQSWASIYKLNNNLDTVFTNFYRKPSWHIDSVFIGFEYITQSTIDSSYYCVGYAQTYLEYMDSVLVVKFDKKGAFIWDKVFKMGHHNIILGAWFNRGRLFLEGCKEKIYPPELAQGEWDYRDNYYIEIDTSGAIINTKIMIGNSMSGGISSNKYDESRSVYIGTCDTLLMPNYLQQDYVTIDQMTLQIGMLDSQYRYVWRTFIPMDTFSGYNYRYRRSHNPGFIGRTKDGGVICGGQKTDQNGYDSTTTTAGIFGGWVMKLDSLGVILWDRTYNYPHPDALIRPKYFSNFCEADNGDIICTGIIFSGSQKGAWLVRLDSQGRLSPTDSGFVGLPFPNFVIKYNYPNSVIEIGKDANEILQLYPNPTTGITQLVYNIHTNGNLNIYDIGGRRVKQIPLQSFQNYTSFDISDLPNGHYIIECATQNRRYTSNLVKE